MNKKTISSTFLHWLLLIVAVAFAVSMAFSWLMQTRTSQRSAVNLLRLNIQDVQKDVMDASDANLLKITRNVAVQLNANPGVNEAVMEALLQLYDIAEINIIDETGIITASTCEDYLGYDMRSGKQSAEFMILLTGSQQELVQNYQPISYNSSTMRKYAAVCLNRGGFVQVAYDAESFHKDISLQVIGVTRNRHVGEGGGIIIADEDWIIVSDRNKNEGKNLSITGIYIDRDTMPEGKVFQTLVYGEPCSCMYVLTEGYYIIATMPRNEIVLQRDHSVRITAILEVVIFLALFAEIFWLVRKLVVNSINRVNSSLSKITGGDLEETVDVRSNVEFSSLSDDINATVSTLKQYIAAASAKIDQELAFAKNIQQSALPSVFPPYPDRTDFNLFASMDTAKEVGGDFYDFYLLDEKRLAFLVADVSGKGIPAAMFMMTGKTVLRDYAERGDGIADIFTNSNNKLCDGNDAEMFITAWMGFLETDTGLVRFVNAGHNPPVLIRNGQASFITQKANLTLAAMENVRYREQTLNLEPEDLLFLYTDGVTEATNSSEELYGNDRLLQVLSADFSGENACERVCRQVKRSLDEFVGEAPQFDDITMLCLYYSGKKADNRNAADLTVEASVDNLASVLAFVDEQLEKAECSPKSQMQIDVAVEELFVNIASYAYAPSRGDAVISVYFENEPKQAVIEFRDKGFPFDPLKKDDPDVTLSAEDRDIGGLGIFMVKKSMDDIFYRREDGQNILTIKKQI